MHTRDCHECFVLFLFLSSVEDGNDDPNDTLEKGLRVGGGQGRARYFGVRGQSAKLLVEFVYLCRFMALFMSFFSSLNRVRCGNMLPQYYSRGGLIH